MMRAALLFVLLASSSAYAAPEKTPSGTEGVPANAGSTPAEEKKICKRFAASESRMGSKRLCLTAAEWKQRQDKEDRLLR